MTVFEGDKHLRLRVAGEVWVRNDNYAPLRIAGGQPIGFRPRSHRRPCSNVLVQSFTELLFALKRIVVRPEKRF